MALVREGPPRPGCALTVMRLSGIWWYRDVPRAPLPVCLPSEDPYVRMRRLAAAEVATDEQAEPAQMNVEPMKQVHLPDGMPGPVLSLLRDAEAAGWACSAWRASADVLVRRKNKAERRMDLVRVRQETWSVRMGRDGVRMALVRTEPDGKWTTGIVAGATVPVMAEVTVTECRRLLVAADVAAERVAIGRERELAEDRKRLAGVARERCAEKGAHEAHVWETGAPRWLHRICDPAVSKTAARQKGESGG